MSCDGSGKVVNEKGWATLNGGYLPTTEDCPGCEKCRPCPCGCWSGGWENGEIVKNACLLDKPCPDCGGREVIPFDPDDGDEFGPIDIIPCPTCQKEVDK